MADAKQKEKLEKIEKLQKKGSFKTIYIISIIFIVLISLLLIFMTIGKVIKTWWVFAGWMIFLIVVGASILIWWLVSRSKQKPEVVGLSKEEIKALAEREIKEYWAYNVVIWEKDRIEQVGPMRTDIFRGDIKLSKVKDIWGTYLASAINTRYRTFLLWRNKSNIDEAEIRRIMNSFAERPTLMKIKESIKGYDAAGRPITEREEIPIEALIKEEEEKAKGELGV